MPTQSLRCPLTETSALNHRTEVLRNFAKRESSLCSVTNGVKLFAVKAADEMTRAFLITAMFLIPIGILMTFDRAMQASGAVVIAFGLAGTLGAGIVRSSPRREVLGNGRATDPEKIRTAKHERS